MPIELLLLVACHKEDDPVVVSDVVATVSERVPTVVTVTWTTSEPTASQIEFGDPPRQTPTESEPTTAHEAVLVGLPPETEVSFTIAGDEPRTVTTGALPGELPQLALTGEPDGLWRTFPVLSPQSDDVPLVVVDPAGQIVWAWTDTRGASVFRAQIQTDGSGIVYSSTLREAEPSEESALIRVSWDGVEEVFPVPQLAHDFVELPDGTLVSLAYDTRDGVLGNKLVAVARDGTASDLWSAFDCFDPVTHPSDDPERGWTHTNALDYHEETDSFLVGMRNLSTIATVDRATGSCGPAYGGSAGDVALEGDEFEHQHQFDLVGDRLLVFDNDGAPGQESRALEYQLGDGTASLVTSFHADPPLYSFILGDVDRQPDGDTLVTWAVDATIDRLAPDGTRELRLAAVGSVLFGFTQSVTDPYLPEE